MKQRRCASLSPALSVRSLGLNRENRAGGFTWVLETWASRAPCLIAYCHLAIRPSLDIAHRHLLKERIGVDQFFACGPTRHISAGHKGSSIGTFCAGQ